MSYISAAELTQKTPTGVRWLVPDLLPLNGLNLLAGEAGAGKTFLALDLALGVALRGEAWGGLRVPRGKVLYYCQDSAPLLIGQRLGAMTRGYDIRPPDDLHFDFDMHTLANNLEMGNLRYRIENEGYKLVIFDVLVRYLPHMTDTSTAVVGPLFAQLRKLSRHTTFLLVHHFSKRQASHRMHNTVDRIRGSSDIIGSMDGAVTVSVSNERRILEAVKNRSGEVYSRMAFTIREDSARDEIKLEWDPSFLQEEETREYKNLVEPILTRVYEFLKDNPDKAFNRSELEMLLSKERLLPSERTMGTVFARLGKMDDVLVIFDGRVKTYRKRVA